MRLVFVVVQSSDVDGLLRAMTSAGIAATQIEGDAAIGKSGLATLIAGVEDDEVAEVVTLVHATARGRSRPDEPLRPIAERAEFWIPGPVDHLAGGASIFVLPIRRFERIGYA